MAAAGAEEEDERATRLRRRRRAAGHPAGARPGRPDTRRRGDRPPSAPRTCALVAAAAAPEETAAEEEERSTAACGRGDTRRGRTAAEASGCGGCTASQRSHLSPRPRNPREIRQRILRQRPKRKGVLRLPQLISRRGIRNPKRRARTHESRLSGQSCHRIG